MEKALEYFNLAIDKDPDWGPPYAGIAEFWILMRQGSFAPYTVTVPSKYENLNKAIELDPNSANTHYVNGLVAVWTGFDWEKGEREFLKALEINPNHAHSRAYYAHLLMMLGKIEEALSEGQIALDLDPLNPMIQALYGAVLIEAGEYNHAVSFFEHSLATAPEHFVSYSTIALAYLLNWDYGKNIEALIKYLYLENETALDINKTFKV
jgi:tetratricopeptide (TPR) repeat protein